MCDGQKHTIDTFFSSPMQKDEQRFMLFDSDMQLKQTCSEFRALIEALK